MLKIGIATTSSEKIEGIVKAISEIFRVTFEEMDVHCAAVESKVASQPFDEDTYKGAENRIREIERIFPGMHVYISCEAGIETAYDKYFNVHIVCVKEETSQTLLFGKSSSWEVPSEDIEIVKKIGLDHYLRCKGVTAIEELVGKPRSAFVAEATAMALSSKKVK